MGDKDHKDSETKRRKDDNKHDDKSHKKDDDGHKAEEAKKDHGHGKYDLTFLTLYLK